MKYLLISTIAIILTMLAVKAYDDITISASVKSNPCNQCIELCKGVDKL
jgi:hypothetical protein